MKPNLLHNHYCGRHEIQEPAMARRVAELKQTEGGSAATVCEAVGERLRLVLAPDPATLPPRLRTLLDQLQLHDTETEPRSR